MITEEQRLERNKGIGGSDIAIIFGLSKYKTPYQLFLEKKGLITLDAVDNNLTYWGNRLESVIVDEFQLRNNVEVQQLETQIHPFYDYMRGNLDGYIPEWNAVLEVKTSMAFMSSEWGEDGTDIIPMQYLLQVAFYCSIMNADSAYIAVLIGGNDYRELKYTRNLELESKVINAAKSFWEAIKANNMPDAQTIDDLRMMFPAQKEEKQAVANQFMADHLMKLSEVKQKIKELEAIENQSRFEIMQFMQDAECLTDESGKVFATWKANKKGSRTFLLKGV